MTNGYEAVMQVARKRDAWWLQAIRECYVYANEQVAAQARGESSGDYFAGSWVLKRLKARTPLAPLVTWDVLERVQPGTQGGKKGWYRMPDREGVWRALRELGFDVEPPRK